MAILGQYRNEILAARDIIRSAKVITRSLGSGSITKLAKESILQFPLISSKDIPFDHTVVIAKALERQYASLFLLTLSQNTQVDERIFGSVSEYLKMFHNNKDFDFASSFNTAIALSQDSTTNVEDIKFEIISANVMESVTPDIVNESLTLSLWDSVEESTNSDVLNDMCKPYLRTEEIIKESINKIKASNEVATEAVENIKKDVDKTLNKVGAKTQGDVIGGNSGYKSIDRKTPDLRNQMEVIRDQKLTMLEPTIIEVQLNFYGEKVQRLVNAMIGIKVMVYQVLSDTMITEMVKSATGSNIIFSFINWTKGTYKFVKDFIFNIGTMKEDAINSQTAGKWFGALRKRRRASKILGTPTNTIPPISTIAMTTNEIEQIKMATGIDLMNLSQAKKMMNNLFLLGFIVEDVTTSHIYTLFDGFDDFAEMSIDTMASNNKREANLTDTKEILKLMGR